MSRLVRRPAAYAPDTGRPICPACWSGLDLDWGKGRGAGGREMRGWGVSRTGRIEEAGEALVTTVVHRCANPDCLTAVEVTTLLAGGYVPALVERRRLAGAGAERHARGRTGRDGVWRDVAGEPRTTPRQRDLFV